MTYRKMRAKHPAIARTSGAHTIYTEVQTLDEAIEVLWRSKPWRKPRKPSRVTIKSIARHGEFESKHAKRIVGVATLREKGVPQPVRLSLTSNKGDPQLYHVVCGRCGTKREDTITKLCPFYMKQKCLGELMRAEQQRELQAKKRKR